ncbi:MAG: LrgB family protein, partial [Spirochaetales bacterium]|nr:LrgB family protein [Spirochaetales bacterium]
MSEAFLSPFACAGLTCAAFALGLGLYRKTRCVFLHPVLVSVTLLIVFLTLANIPYETYNRGGGYISVFLSPAVVALGVSLYKEAARIRREALPLFLTTLVGSLTGLISVVVPAVLLGAPKELTISLAPKSVTTAIAVEISSRLGGVPSLSAAIVILTGVFGTALGPLVLRL